MKRSPKCPESPVEALGEGGPTPESDLPAIVDFMGRKSTCSWPGGPNPRAAQARARPKVRPEGWEPFVNAPERVRRYYRGLLARAHREPRAAMQLFCIECMGYSARKAANCACLSCPLYAFNRRIFGSEPPDVLELGTR